MSPVSFTDREALWQDMLGGAAAEWDVIVIGGGITGAGILREAVRLGYRSLLIEQRDFAWGSSSRSSKMVHGGLRYLAAGQLSLTRHALQEREKLIREAPRLVQRLGYYFPLYRGQWPPRLAAGALFWLYDRLAGVRDHRRVDNAELAREFTGLDTGELNGGFYYTDAVTDDARLTLRVLQESVRGGGSLRNYTRANRLLRDGGRVCGLLAEDLESGRQVRLGARVVINATGAWADRLGNAALAGMKIRPQRGSHLVLSASRFPVESAIFLLHPADGRRLFVYPWEGRTVIGTTDIRHGRDLDTAASMTAEELDYLLLTAGRLFAGRPPLPGDVISSWSGVRPIITMDKTASLSKASREHRVWVEDGLVSCSGGKLTTFHHMALDVMSRARSFLPPVGEPGDRRIFAAHGTTGEELLARDPERGERLLGRYGEDAVPLIASAPVAETEVIPGTRTCLAQLRWALRHESVVHLDDLMLRRTRLGLLLENGGEAMLDDVRRLCRDERGWSPSRWEQERNRYRGVIERYYAVPGVR